LLDRYDGREFLYRRLQAKDGRAAKVEADAWEAGLRLEWMEMAGQPLPEVALRDLYQRVRNDAVAGEFLVDADGRDAEPSELEGISYEIEKIAEAVGPEGEPDAAQQARLFALNDARMELLGKKVK